MYAPAPAPYGGIPFPLRNSIGEAQRTSFQILHPNRHVRAFPDRYLSAVDAGRVRPSLAAGEGPYTASFGGGRYEATLRPVHQRVAPPVYDSPVYVRSSFRAAQRSHSTDVSAMLTGVIGMAAAVGGAASFCNSQEALQRSEIGLSRLDELERSLHQSDNSSTTSIVREIADRERSIFNRVREASSNKKALAIAAIVGGVLMTLGVLLSAVTVWAEVAIVLGTLCLLATGIAAAIIAIQNGFSDPVVEDALEIERRVDALHNSELGRSYVQEDADAI